MQVDSVGENDVDVVVSPNPMVENAYVQVVTELDESVVLTLVDAMGRTRETLYSGTIVADTPMRWSLISSSLGGDLFWVRCATASGKLASAQVLRVE